LQAQGQAMVVAVCLSLADRNPAHLLSYIPLFLFLRANLKVFQSTTSIAQAKFLA